MGDIDTMIQKLVDAQAPYIESQEFGMEFTVSFPVEKCQGIINELLEVTPASRILQKIIERQAGAPPYLRLYELLLPYLGVEIAIQNGLSPDIAEMISKRLKTTPLSASKKRQRTKKKKKKKKRSSKGKNT